MIEQLETTITRLQSVNVLEVCQNNGTGLDAEFYVQLVAALITAVLAVCVAAWFVDRGAARLRQHKVISNLRTAYVEHNYIDYKHELDIAMLEFQKKGDVLKLIRVAERRSYFLMRGYEKDMELEVEMAVIEAWNDMIRAMEKAVGFKKNTKELSQHFRGEGLDERLKEIHERHHPAVDQTS